jgi:hypothetical protein
MKFLGYVCHLQVTENPHKFKFCKKEIQLCIGICKFDWTQYGSSSI